MVVMIAFGQIDFFESLTCEQLELYMTDDIRGKYPLETPFKMFNLTSFLL